MAKDGRSLPLPRQDIVARTSTKKLKIYTEQPPRPERPQIEMLGCLPEVLRAFRTATGWSLRYAAGPESRSAPELPWSAPVNPGVGASPGHLRLEPIDSEPALQAKRGQKAEGGRRKAEGGRAGNSLPADRPSPIGLDAARSLASSIAGMVNELMETRHALWQREAELAAGVPLVPHAEEEQHLAARLEAVLRGGAQAVDCQAAALYLLDDATTHLKLRSSWGLPFDRLTAAARPLKGSVADLEALLGHAVVLQDAELMQRWSVPEDFPAAVCVPVSTPTMLLGTLWVFSDRKRDFNDRQTNILEVVAGRLASDLEREMLLREGTRGRAVETPIGGRRTPATQSTAVALAAVGRLAACRAGRYNRSPSAAISTIGSACPTDCWPWPSATRPTGASRRRWPPRP